MPRKESGGTSTIYISSEVTSEPDSFIKNEYEMDPLGIKEEPFEVYQVVQGNKRKHEDSEVTSCESGVENKYEMDPLDIKGEVSENYEVARCKRRKLEGKQYLCNECNYAATRAAHLRQHKESKHEGIRYPCSECDYVATRAECLKRHKKSKHEGISYPCSECVMLQQQ